MAQAGFIEIIGMTTMVPVEPVFSAGKKPADLNNLFINSGNSEEYIKKAENDGLPRNFCTWVKGIYSAVMIHGIKKVIIPVTGDCSSCLSLGELLENYGVEIIPFFYPHRRNVKKLYEEISLLCEKIGTDPVEAEKVFNRFSHIRKDLLKLDEAAYVSGSVSGKDLFDFQVAASDFNGNPDEYHLKLKKILDNPVKPCSGVRLGVCGVPPVMNDLPFQLEAAGGCPVFYEIPRQFALPEYEKGMTEAYSSYLYPYDLKSRITDLKKQIRIRELKGLIYYLQSFCHRQLEAVTVKKEIDIPVMFLEGDQPGSVNAQQMMRLEAFIQML